MSERTGKEIWEEMEIDSLMYQWEMGNDPVFDSDDIEILRTCDNRYFRTRRGIR